MHHDIYLYGMHMRLHHIVPDLQPYIREICSMAPDGDPAYIMRILPDTCIELFINYHEQPIGQITCGNSHNVYGSFLNARLNGYMDVQMNPQSRCMGICFKPGMAYAFFGISMRELGNGATDLRNLWPSVAGEIEERMALATDNDKRALIIQQYLLQVLHKTQRLNGQILHLLHQANLYKGHTNVSQLAKAVNLSERQLNRKFTEHMGLSPKEYLNVSRFLHALEILKTRSGTSLTETAYECGYYDQAHFIHDCKRYAGYAPATLLRTSNLVY